MNQAWSANKMGNYNMNMALLVGATTIPIGSTMQANGIGSARELYYEVHDIVCSAWKHAAAFVKAIWNLRIQMNIRFENIIKMYARMWNKADAVWMANEDTFQQLASMSLQTGTGGVPVWLPAGGVSGRPYDTLMGKPLIWTEHCQTLGTKGDILFADWTQYLVGQRAGAAGGMKFASSIHLKFDYAKMIPYEVTRIEEPCELMGTPNFEYANAA